MKKEINLPLKAKHFIDTRFIDQCNCAIAKAAKDFFNTEEVTEHVGWINIKGRNFIHKDYGVDDFDSDKKKAETETESETIIRIILLREI